jgi:hypothetical protein
LYWIFIIDTTCNEKIGSNIKPVKMKKIVLVIIWLVITARFSFAAISGNGTYANPYTGSISSSGENFTIPIGVSYFNSISVSGTGVLTISAGATLYAVSTSTIISTSGTGAINAVGSLGNIITFSADNDNNGSWNSGDSWDGFYIFSSGSTQIEYAIIERGTANPTNGHGGGVYIFGRNVSIKNSTIRFCSAINGGGINAQSSASPNGITLENLKIHDNTASGTGGGLFMGGSGVSVIAKNCEIYNNNSTGRGDGVYMNNGSGLSQVFNSLIYNNSGGDGIYLVSSTNVGSVVNTTVVNNGIGIFVGPNLSPTITNSVFWGNSSSQIGLGSGATPSVTNCGVQGGYAGVTNIYLNVDGLDNGDDDDPHFTNSSSDWSLRFFSPLKDAGTSGGSPAPLSTDINGKNRVYTYDIGAFEMQYSRWTGANSTTWSAVGNWSGNVDPATGTGDVVIPAGLSTYPNPVTTTQDFTLGAGKFMILESGAQVTLDDLTNNGTLNLNSDASGIASLMINSYTKGGGATENIQLYLTGGGSTLWHYISPPVSSVQTTLFSDFSERSVVRYEENYITNDWNNGWVNYQGYHYNSTANQWQSGAGTWSTLDAGRGYNYNSSTTRTYTISGQINTSDKSITLDFGTGGAGNPSYQGYNLIGNPFTSGIDWDSVVLGNSTLFSGQVEQAIYFRSNGTLNTYLSGVSVPSGWSGGQIPPMQGFFIKSNTNGVTLTIPATAKVHTGNPRLKGVNIIPLVRLQIQNSGRTDETVVRFDEKATLGFDNAFDARKLYPASDIPAISSSFSGIEYTINGLPFPETSVTIPILFTAPVTGSYSISSNELTGLENYKVTLTDKDQGITTDLSEAKSYSFSSLSGKFAARFILKVSNSTTSLPEVSSSKTDFNIYYTQGILNIQTIGESWDGVKGDIGIYDLTGRQLLLQKNNEFQPGFLLQVSGTFRTGAYIVEIRSGVNRYVGKVVIR